MRINPFLVVIILLTELFIDIFILSDSAVFINMSIIVCDELLMGKILLSSSATNIIPLFLNQFTVSKVQNLLKELLSCTQ